MSGKSDIIKEHLRAAGMKASWGRDGEGDGQVGGNARRGLVKRGREEGPKGPLNSDWS